MPLGCGALPDLEEAQLPDDRGRCLLRTCLAANLLAGHLWARPRSTLVLIDSGTDGAAHPGSAWRAIEPRHDPCFGDLPTSTQIRCRAMPGGLNPRPRHYER